VVSTAIAPNDVPAARAAITAVKSCFFIAILLDGPSGFCCLFFGFSNVKLDQHFIGDDRGVFPFARADAELTTLDRQGAVESLRRTLLRDGDR